MVQGIMETHEDRKRDRERGRAADKYDELDKGKKDRHWSEKARSEMTERDWRIFREDFNIAYKGVNVSATALPLRNWAEAELPDELNQVGPLLAHEAQLANFCRIIWHVWIAA